MSGPLPGAHSVGTGDFDGDGLSDLLVFEDTGTSCFINLGGGVFQRRGDIIWRASDYRSDDLNGDGLLDLIFLGMYVMGQGDGTFVEAVPFPGLSCAITDWAVADLDLDGPADLVQSAFCPADPPTSPANGYVVLYRSQGGGAFVFDSLIDADDQVSGLAVGDFDLDGRPDLAGAHTLSDSVSVILSGAGGALASIVHFAVGSAPVDIATGDFNGDNIVDVVTANSGSNDLSVRDGVGNGMLGAERRLPAGIEPVGVETDDMDSDGTVDIVVANRSSGSLMVLLGDGQGGFAAPILRTVGQNPIALAVGDLNGDGRKDVITLNDGSEDLSVLLGEPGTTLGQETRLPLATEASRVLLADFDGDQRLDLGTSGSTYSGIYSGQGDGTFVFSGHYRQSGIVTAGDFDGNGVADLAGDDYVLLNRTCTPRPAPVAGLQVARIQGGAGLQMTWSPAANAESYLIYEDVAPDGPFETVAGTTGACGNDVCEPALGETCSSCADDCNGVQGGNPASRYCCGDGVSGGDNPVGCEDARCTDAQVQCFAVPGTPGLALPTPPGTRFYRVAGRNVMCGIGPLE